MLWTSIFIISVAQGLFLVALLLLRGSKNHLASRFLMAMIGIMVLTNFGYLIIRTDLINYIPKMYAVPFGMVYLLGPLFFFYSRSVIDRTFAWKHIYWIHFLPYLLQLAYTFPFYTVEKVYVIQFIKTFLAGELFIRDAEKISFLLQDLHMSAYLVFTFRWLKKTALDKNGAQLIVSVSSRIRWVRELLFCFAFFVTTLIGLYIFIMFKGKYDPVTNYIYTLITSATIYFIAFRMVLSPGLINPDFVAKYRSYMPFEGEEGERYLQRVKALLENEKVYTDPELKLSSFADKLELPPHQLSKLINEKFGKTFNDLICEYRVNEFLLRVNDPGYKAFSIYGLALEVGFNSKSSFNSAFKRITGNTPSAYRR